MSFSICSSFKRNLADQLMQIVDCCTDEACTLNVVSMPWMLTLRIRQLKWVAYLFAIYIQLGSFLNQNISAVIVAEIRPVNRARSISFRKNRRQKEFNMTAEVKYILPVLSVSTISDSLNSTPVYGTNATVIVGKRKS